MKKRQPILERKEPTLEVSDFIKRFPLFFKRCDLVEFIRFYGV